MSKIHRLSLVVLLCLSLFTVKGWGQGTYGHVTPQTADFMKYGDVPVSLFTGQMNLEIPLYRIQDQEFDVPIRLLYTADGFKPEKRADFVGLDWTLIAGGCITREVYGVPDDFRATSSEEEDGFLRVIKNRKYQDKDGIWNMNSPVLSRDPVMKTYYLEISNDGFYQDYQPDLFMFNFNGHTGQFMINNYGKGQANHPGYKVDISGVTEQRADLPNRIDASSTIRITTPDGYLYEFGGSLGAIEYSIYYEDHSALSYQPVKPTILAWHLSKITAPNGRTVKFNYVEEGGDVGETWDRPMWQAGRGALQGSLPTGPTFVSATKKAILESIVVGRDGVIDHENSVTVEFKRSIETTLAPDGYFFPSQHYHNRATYQLDTVIVKYRNHRVFTYALGYENHYKRRFLSSVLYPDGSQYAFEYKHTVYPTKLNALLSNSLIGPETDDFGYWRNNNHESSFGLMSKITYPTGGFSLLTYERKDFDRAVDFQVYTLDKTLVPSSNSYTVTEYREGHVKAPDEPEEAYNEIDLPPAEPVEGGNTQVVKITRYYLHGARIKAVTNYSSASVVETKKEYIYADAIHSGTGSGILYQTRPYFTDKKGDKVSIIESSWKKNYNIDEPPVGYSFVIEKREDGSYIRYKFSDYNTTPDLGGDINLKLDNYPTVVTNYLLLASVGVNRVSSNTVKRGLLLETMVVDAHGVEQLHEERAYSHVGIQLKEVGAPQRIDQPLDSNCIVSFRGCPGGGISRKIYLKTYPKIRQKSVIDGVVSDERYSYNRYDQLSSKTIAIDQTDTLQVNYTYPTECSASYCSRLTKDNRLSTVIEQATLRISGTAPPLEIERIHTDYMLIGRLMVPSAVRSTRFGSGQWRTDITYNAYDGDGRVLQQTAIDKVPVTFIWGYNNLYRIAEIRNADYATVMGKLSGRSDSLVIDERSAVAGLRTAFHDDPVLINTYTYDPLIGISSHTDPNGITTYYEYDGMGHLKRVRDYEGNVLKESEVHYFNE